MYESLNNGFVESTMQYFDTMKLGALDLVFAP